MIYIKTFPQIRFDSLPQNYIEIQGIYLLFNRGEYYVRILT